MNHQGIFITGTDTNVGKTLTSVFLAVAFKQTKKPFKYFKPIQTGTDLDTDTVIQLARLKCDEFCNPVYQFLEPIAPSRAALKNGEQIKTGPIKSILTQHDETAKNFWIIEGAGGLLVPINSTQTIRDLAMELGFPIIVVASTRLGTINHTLLTIEAARIAGCRIAGLVLNGQDDLGLEEYLSGFTAVPLLARIYPQRLLNPDIVQTLKVFSEAALHSILSPKGAC